MPISHLYRVMEKRNINVQCLGKGVTQMDTFVNKLAQKRNAQEMIKANTTAEAVQMEQMQNQMAAYDGLLQEMRRINIKTAGNAMEAQNLLRECMEKIKTLQQEENAEGNTDENMQQTLEEVKTMLDEYFKQSDDFLHKENVRVYRNVQAVMVEELNKQTEAIKAETAEIKEMQEAKSGKAQLVLTVLLLIGVAADIAVNVLTYLAITMK